MIALFGQEFIPIVALGGQVKGARPQCADEWGLYAASEIRRGAFVL